ncbi:MAG TPA: hypothetical protein VLA79_01505, partial [Polyangia bacterium]|nr:hypothetical protein [Polyangia bacterium]
MAEPASRRRSGLPRWRKRLGLAIGLAAALIAAGNGYLLGTTRAAVAATVAEAPARPFVIVLGNRVFPDGTPSEELAARLETGRQLYVAGRAGKI